MSFKKVRIFVSDPWSFYDQNGGDAGLSGFVVAEPRDDLWLVRLERAAAMAGRMWGFAAAVSRHASQAPFSEVAVGTQMAANIIFVDAADVSQIERGEFSRDKVGDAWGVGSIEVVPAEQGG